MSEEWRTIEGFPRYEVSNLGQVRSRVRPAARILKAVTCSKGYLQVSLWENGRRWQPMIHQLVNHAFNGPPPNEYQSFDTHHKRDRANVPDNLEWVIHQEHWRHNRKRG